MRRKSTRVGSPVKSRQRDWLPRLDLNQEPTVPKTAVLPITPRGSAGGEHSSLNDQGKNSQPEDRPALAEILRRTGCWVPVECSQARSATPRVRLPDRLSGTNVYRWKAAASARTTRSPTAFAHKPCIDQTPQGRRPQSVRFVLFGSGDRIRTCDLRVMSPTSYLTAPPRIRVCG